MILHKKTQAVFEKLLADPPHALLLTGPASKGALFEAIELAQRLRKNHGGTFLQLQPPKDKKAITIEQIKDLYHEARGRQKAGLLVVVIPFFDAIHTDAQNAFLKLLEEPGDNIVFILEARHANRVLTTIASRAQRIELNGLDVPSAIEYAVQKKIDTQTASQLLFLSENNASDFMRLISEPSYQKKSLALAGECKSFFNQTIYQRLVITQSYAKNRDDALSFLRILARMAELLLKSQPKSHIYINVIDQADSAYRAIAANGHVKIQLLRFVSSLAHDNLVY